MGLNGVNFAGVRAGSVSRLGLVKSGKGDQWDITDGLMINQRRKVIVVLSSGLSCRSLSEVLSMGCVVGLSMKLAAAWDAVD